MRRLLLASLLIFSCSFSFCQWQKVYDIDSFARSRPATFVIGDTVYLGNGDPGGFVYAPPGVPANQDFYAYTLASNTWTSIRKYPGGGGDWGIRFQIGDTAYIGGGANPGWQSDFWKYTPKQGWVSLGNTPNSMAMGSNSCFVIGNKGYICTGDWSGTAIDSVWEYDPITNKFTSKAHYPSKRQSGVAFTANGYGYVGLGGDGSGRSYKDMYRYDPVADKWDTMAPLPADTGFVDAGFFTLCGKLVVTMGDSVQTGTSTTNQTWLFDPYKSPKGAWYRLPNYPGPRPSYAPGAFTINNAGYIYGGWNQPAWGDRSEMYRFDPSRSLMQMLAYPLDTAVCSGNPVTLRGVSSQSYLWNTGDTTANITVSPTTSTTYVITETSGGCVYLDTIQVNVSSGSPLTASANPPAICTGQQSTLTVTPAAGTFQWYPSAGLTDSTSASITVAPTVTTTYIVTQPGGGSCSSIGQVVVTVGNTAVGGTVSAVRDTLCAGTPGNLSLSGNSNSSLQWQSSTDEITFANAVNDTSAKYKTAPLLQSTWYRVMVGSGNCSAISDTLQLYVPPALTAFFSDSQIVAHWLTFNADSSKGDIKNYHWDFGDGQTSSEKNPQHTYTKDTIYYICLTLYDGSNCSYTFCRYSDVTDAVQNFPAAGKWAVYPNPFSDEFVINGNGLNRTIKSIELYDVLGRMVYNKEYKSQGNAIPVNLQGFAQGMYYLEIKTTDANYFQPIIKQR